MSSVKSTKSDMMLTRKGSFNREVARIQKQQKVQIRKLRDTIIIAENPNNADTSKARLDCAKLSNKIKALEIQEKTWQKKADACKIQGVDDSQVALWIQAIEDPDYDMPDGLPHEQGLPPMQAIDDPDDYMQDVMQQVSSRSSGIQGSGQASSSSSSGVNNSVENKEEASQADSKL
jgi:hypothetical protein